MIKRTKEFLKQPNTIDCKYYIYNRCSDRHFRVKGGVCVNTIIKDFKLNFD